MQQLNPAANGDDKVVAYFKQIAIVNPAKTAEAGRPICDDMEVCVIQAPGSRSTTTYQPATARSHWVTDPLTGAQTAITYAERFSRQYQQFKRAETQTLSGTPLEHCRFLTEARRAELRALNVYTAEQLAALDGQELKNIGQNGRDLKNAAQAYLDEARKGAPNAQMVAELDALRARNQVLEDDVAALKQKAASADSKFDGMTDEQLRDYIKAHSGHTPQGLLSRKTLLRMAAEV